MDLLEGLDHAVRLDVRVPVLLPAVALPTHLALERLQAHVLVHVLLEVFGLIEPLVTAAGVTRTHIRTSAGEHRGMVRDESVLTERRQTLDRQVWAGASSCVCSELRPGGTWLHTCCTGTLTHLLGGFHGENRHKHKFTKKKKDIFLIQQHR